MGKSDQAYRVHGTIVESETERPVAGIRVRAYDKDFFREQLLGEGETDGNGRYAIAFGRDAFTGPLIRLERHPDIFLQLYDGEGRIIYSTERSVVVGAGRDTAIDLRIPWRAGDGEEPGMASLFGVAVNLPEVARLSAGQILDAYRLMRGATAIRDAGRLRRAFPGLFREEQARPECGNGIPQLFRYLLMERNASHLLDAAEADTFGDATVREFFTANIVVKYTTDATLPDGNPNPNALPAASATLPAADSAYTMPSGTLIGTVRASLAELHPDNSEVAPTYIQKVGLLAEHSLSKFIAAPFSYLDPRGGLARLEFRILNLGPGVAGYAYSDFHMELNTSNSDGQNLGTVPHELFHLVQYRYNGTGNVAGGVRQMTVEGGARLIEESINETPDRYVASAAEGNVGGSVARKGIFAFPEETLIDVGGTSSLLRYAAGLFWKYIAEQHSTRTGAADEPAIGVDAYRTIIERMTPAADGFTVAALRNGRAQLPWYGTFDQFSYYDAAATELSSHETSWGNFLVANYFHRLSQPGAAGHDRRFDYLEDEDPAGSAGAQLNTFGPAVAAGNQIAVVQGTAASKNVVGHKPYAAVYYELTPGMPAPRMLQISVTTAGGMSDPVIQILRIGAGDVLVDLHRSDRTAWSKTINMAGLAKVVVIVASREDGGDFTISFDEVAAASDVMVTRWNSAVGTEYEVDPAGWSWAWISPDIMVDSNDDLLDDTEVFFGQDNKLKVRLRNRGNAAASGIRVDFWYQKATPFLTSAGWIPVQNQAMVTQVLTGLTLAPGAEQWFGVDWAPVDDGTGQHHYCVKVLVTVAGDPNADNKMAFRNFNNLDAADPDTQFDTLVRFADWREGDLLQVVPRNPTVTLLLENFEGFPRPLPQPGHPCRCGARIIHGAPLDMAFARLQVAAADLEPWDGRVTLAPDASSAFYPVDERTLPPGIKSSEIVTVAHVREGQPFGGVSYRIPSR